MSENHRLRALCAELEYRVVTARAFDRELLSESEPVLTLTITCADGGPPPAAGRAGSRAGEARTAKQTLTVRVVDRNDNAPTFTQAEYVRRVQENVEPAVVGALVQTRATDADEGLNGELTYYLAIASVGCENASAARGQRQRNTRGESEEERLLHRLFAVEPHTGDVRVREKLDYEARASYSFLVCARDAGEPAPLIGSAAVRIDVADVNDNAPSFERALYVFNVTEGRGGQLLTGTVIGRLRAADCDATLANSQITAQIDGRRVRGFEPEDPDAAEAFYEVTGKPIAKLPFILTPVTSASASAAAAEILGGVEVAASATENGIHCSSSAWDIVVNGELDRESVARYEFAVMAFDSGSPRTLNSSVNISVHVLDVNDCAPEFKLPAENNTLFQFNALHLNPGEPVLHVAASDRDLVGSPHTRTPMALTGATANRNRLSYTLRQLKQPSASPALAAAASSSAAAQSEPLFTMNASSGGLVVARRPTIADAGPHVWLVEATDGLHSASIYFQVCPPAHSHYLQYTVLRLYTVFLILYRTAPHGTRSSFHVYIAVTPQTFLTNYISDVMRYDSR